MRNLSQCDGWRFLRLVPQQHLFSEHIDFALFRHFSGQSVAVAGPPQFIELPEGTATEPTFRLHATEAQELMDMLWNIGLRPTQGKQMPVRWKPSSGTSLTCGRSPSTSWRLSSHESPCHPPLLRVAAFSADLPHGRYWDADHQLHFCVWRQWLGRCFQRGRRGGSL